jgi:hypothetical protein
MLKVRCFAGFDGPDHAQILILGSMEDYARAAAYLMEKESAMLNDPNIFKYYERNIISTKELYLNKKECMELAEIFSWCSTMPGKYHYYYETNALSLVPSPIDIRISHREYSEGIFDDPED